MTREEKQILTRIYRELGSVATQVAGLGLIIKDATAAMRELNETLKQGELEDAEEERDVQGPRRPDGD